MRDFNKTIKMHCGNISAHLSNIRDGGKSYREQYLTLVNFLTALKNTSIIIKAIPKQFQTQVSNYDSAVEEFIDKYADYLSDKLESLPGDICRSLSRIKTLATDASVCAGSLANGSEDVKKDLDSILLALYYSDTLIEKYVLDNYNALLESLDEFYSYKTSSGDLLTLKSNMDELVSLFTQSHEYYTDDMAKLQNDIDSLYKEISKLNKQVAGSGIAMGASVFLGASTVALLLASGAGAPLAVIAGVTAGVFFSVGAAVFANAAIKINAAQKTIASKAATLSEDKIAIVQVDNYKKTFSAFVDGMDDIKRAVVDIKTAWLNLSKDFNDLAAYIGDTTTDTIDVDVDWELVQADFVAISQLADDVIAKVNELNVADVRITDGKFDFTMDAEKMNDEFEKSRKLSVTVYLKSA